MTRKSCAVGMRNATHILTITAEFHVRVGERGYVQPKGYGFSAVLVINRVSILAGFGHFGHK